MAYGKFGGGDGSKENPFLVEDERDLSAIRFKPQKAYRLARDINLGVPPFDKTGWMPIKNFTGELDGAGHKIFNLYINAPKKDNVGLFSALVWTYSNPPMIHDISIENAVVYGHSGVGILAGSITCNHTVKSNMDAARAMIARVHVSGNVSGSDLVGGIFGAVTHPFTYAVSTVLMEDITAKVIIKPGTDTAHAALLIGHLASGTGTVTISRIVLEGECALNETGENISSVCSQSSAAKVNLELCFVNGDRWNGGETAGAKILTEEEMHKKSSFAELEVEGVQNEVPTWHFAEGRVPELFFVKKDNLFLHSDGKFYAYENEQWVMKHDNIAVCKNANGGMKDLNIPLKAWKEAQDQFGSIDIVNAISKSNGIQVSVAQKEMSRKKSLEKNKNKQKYSMEFSFDKADIFCFESM